MSKILQTLKEKWMLFLLLALLLGNLLYLFVPRNLGTLADLDGADVESISLFCYPAINRTKNFETVTLTEAEQQQFLEMMKNTYVFRNPIDKKYTNDDDFGFIFEIVRTPTRGEHVPPLVHYFTEDIISVNGIQYRFYGDAFEEWFEELVDRD